MYSASMGPDLTDNTEGISKRFRACKAHSWHARFSGPQVIAPDHCMLQHQHGLVGLQIPCHPGAAGFLFPEAHMRNLLSQAESFGRVPPSALVAACKQSCQSSSCRKV